MIWKQHFWLFEHVGVKKDSLVLKIGVGIPGVSPNSKPVTTCVCYLSGEHDFYYNSLDFVPLLDLTVESESSRFHHLKLYADDETAPQTTKKPVVVEAYDEIVLSEPMEASFGRLRNHPAVRVLGNPTSPLPLPGIHPLPGQPSMLMTEFWTDSVVSKLQIIQFVCNI